MKIYISSDIEGVTGVVSWEHSTEKGSRDYEVMRRRMTNEVAAAANAALESGAGEVVVADSHANSTNLIHEDLPKKVKLIQGTQRPLSMMEGVDESFAAAMFVGYHSMRNTLHGTLNHSFSGRSIYEIRLNGNPIGEFGLNAAMAGVFGVPVIFASGDRALCEEAQELIPGIITVETKRGIGMIAAESLHPEVSCELIKSGAAEAVANKGNMKPYRIEGEVHLEIDFVRTGHADAAGSMPRVERISPKGLACKAADYTEAYQALRTLINLASTFPLQ
ncbi:MAG: peptidase M55 [Planctomycetota bacterium]|nr:MAG: peptidase M55 [Planctomycetota bacterium]